MTVDRCVDLAHNFVRLTFPELHFIEKHVGLQSMGWAERPANIAKSSESNRGIVILSKSSSNEPANVVETKIVAGFHRR